MSPRRAYCFYGKILKLQSYIEALNARDAYPGKRPGKIAQKIRRILLEIAPRRRWPMDAFEPGAAALYPPLPRQRAWDRTWRRTSGVKRIQRLAGGCFPLCSGGQRSINTGPAWMMVCR
jgi:hypothetical protein